MPLKLVPVPLCVHTGCLKQAVWTIENGGVKKQVCTEHVGVQLSIPHNVVRSFTIRPT